MHRGLEKMMPKEKVAELVAIGTCKVLTAGEYYLRAGTQPKSIAFLISGLFRYVYINDKGIEYTKGIFNEGSFLVSYSAMVSETSSHFYIEALENAEILVIPYIELKKLMDSDVFWIKFVLSMVEKGFVIKEKRERELLLLDAESRYLIFLEEYPTIEKRVKQIIVASYLGIHPESLSRIKKKLKT